MENNTRPAHHGRLDITELSQLAASGLLEMLDKEQRVFCFRLNRTKQGMVREGASRRYTIMSLLGLYRLEALRPGSTPIVIDPIRDALLDRPDWLDNIGDLGLLLWLCALTSPERLESLYAKLKVAAALDRFGGAAEGVTMELAWFLAGLSHAALAGGCRLAGLTPIAIRTFKLLRDNQGSGGFFGHQTRRRSVRGWLRGRIGSFADQVYPIYAMAKYGQAFTSRDALTRARRCADSICLVQGPLGQWWWHYDALTDKVFQRYPVYAVHQEGMAPMALFALMESSALDFREPIYKGLAWIGGRNELERDLRQASPHLVWRCVYLRNSVKMYVRELSNFLHPSDRPISPGDLTIRYECRPYELGWLLYAFAGKDGLWSGAA